MYCKSMNEIPFWLCKDIKELKFIESLGMFKVIFIRRGGGSEVARTIGGKPPTNNSGAIIHSYEEDAHHHETALSLT